ncbi:DUF4192 domain-containing protein [Nonomuraea sp. CA-141351]|uniref:DUF4192 domain-containing protein n=1 Tax=Nonomuraea sp. CA-141351 TaxID=3239996 RepID=UPI003D89FC34
MTETVRLSHPTDYLAIVPYLLGFHPTLSLVILAFHDQALVNTMRHDLPDCPHEARDLIATSLNILARHHADEVAVIGYGPAGQLIPLLEDVREALSSAEVRIRQLLRCADGRYWHHLDARPDEGTPYDLTINPAAAGAVVAGLCALPDREAFAATLAPAGGPDRQAVREATRAAREHAAALLDSAPPRYWYDEGLRRVREAFARSAADEPLSAEEVAWLGVLLTSIVVRDRAMTLLGHYTAAAHIALWGELTRRAEPGYVAAPATLLAFAAYSSGAGTLARIALDRALADNPRYSMAALLDWALSHAAPPSLIHDMHIADQADVIEAQVERCPKAVPPRLPEPVEGR